MQDGFYAGYHAPRPPPGMMMDPHYPPPPIGLPTSATRGSWQPAAVPPPWPGPDGQPLPPPGMYIPASYYPSPYYRHPGMPPHLPQINPELLAQSNGNGIGPPESSLRNTSADVPKVKRSASASSSTGVGEHSPRDEDEGPDESTLMAAAALQAVLAYQKEKEQEAREAEARKPSQSDANEAPSQVVRVERPPNARPSIVPTTQIDPDLDTVGEPNGAHSKEPAERGKEEEFVSEGGTPMLNPAELLTQVGYTVSIFQFPRS
uniref:Protein kinase domain-containing protein n=1 Tax=Ganoderma boninense TaxID=34458 RepID=A0A5K1K6V4_9APHY|nr:Protein kinase domain-containing protein [Ganoderma boninense]